MTDKRQPQSDSWFSIKQDFDSVKVKFVNTLPRKNKVIDL